uniref:Uncharacterized protein n=1 Tax=Amphimedon queenslandica TaxID=400682 RepID=A0A1X7VJR4_AMPQE
MGTLPAVSRQLLVQGTPDSLENANKDASQVEYGHSFRGDRVPQSPKCDTTVDKGACCNIHQDGSKLQERRKTKCETSGELSSSFIPLPTLSTTLAWSHFNISPHLTRSEFIDILLSLAVRVISSLGQSLFAQLSALDVIDPALKGFPLVIRKDCA